MINNYFGFTKDPFPRSTNDKDIFIWKDFENLKNRLLFFIKQGGIFLLSGMIGSGKTTALRNFAGSLNPNSHRLFYFNDSFANKRDFYRTILRSLDQQPLHYVEDAKFALKRTLLDMCHIKRIIPIIVFDEAQNLPGFIFEEIRLLSNFDLDCYSPALFIISGHNLLKQRISAHENEALNQRIFLHFHIQGMDLQETCAYINHCLKLSSSTSAIFSDSILNKIHEVSNGIPRKINKVCNALLLAAVAFNKKIIDDYVFAQASGEWD